MSYRSRGFNLTLLLIIINVIVFLVVTVLQTKLGPNFVYYLAVQPKAILHLQNLWTLVTNMFVHASFVYLFVNMVSLYFIGNFLEKLIGKKKFILIYLVSGIVASLFFVFLASSTQLEIPAVGASGAIFGVAGVLALIAPRVPVYIFFIPIATPLWIGVVIALAVTWFASLTAGLPIGNTAHLGGLIAGVLYGLYLRKKYAKKVAFLDSMFKRMYH